MCLFYLNRSRVDLLGGFLGGLRRVFLRGRMRDGMRNNLTETVRTWNPRAQRILRLLSVHNSGRNDSIVLRRRGALTSMAVGVRCSGLGPTRFSRYRRAPTEDPRAGGDREPTRLEFHHTRT